MSTNFQVSRNSKAQNPNNTQLLTSFFDELVSILNEDQNFDLLLHLTDSVTINLLKHPVDKEKILRSIHNSHSIIGCKMFVDAVLTYLNKATDPDYANLMLIFEGNQKLTCLLEKIREKAIPLKIKFKEKICSVQLPLPEAHENKPAKCIQQLRSSLQLPPDPKCSPLVTQSVSEFIPLDKVSLKGESPIGQTSQLSIDELCNVPPSSWILIRGISGIGKSTLAYEMLKQWKDGTALQKYSYALLLRLRNQNVHQYWSTSPNVAQLIEECLNEQYIEPPEIKNILDDKGHNLLLILEGYDELPKEKFKFQMKVFYQLKCDFHNAVVVLTTRSSFSYKLSQNILFTKEIEIVGFSKSNHNQYIKNALKNNGDKIEEFKESIKSRPIIAQYLNVPLHLAIMIEIVFSGSQKPLPQTITELYKSFVMILICRQSKNEMLNDFGSLPLNEKCIFKKLCELAYESLFVQNKQRIAFDWHESNTLGLMQRESSDDGSMTQFSFLHFKIQEFLGAYYIILQGLSLEEHFEANKNFRQLSHALQFLAGFTNLEESFHIDRLSKEDVLYRPDHFHQLMEINNDALASEVLHDRTIDASTGVSKVLTLQDFYVLGRCFALSSCSWKFGFTLRGLSSEHIKMFVSGFNDVNVMPQSQQSPNLERIVLSLNPIGNKGLATFLSLPTSVLHNISEFFLRAASLKNNYCFKNCITKFEHLDALKIFLFHDNDFKKGEQQQLIDVLCTLKNLKKVSFSSLSPHECFTLLSQSHLTHLELYELSPESVKKLLASLTKCKTLECIELYQSPITKKILERSLRHSLPHCTLKELKLINCKIDSQTAILIIDAAARSPTLQVIDLSDNVIDDKGGCYIASKLEELLVSRARPSPSLQSVHETKDLHNLAENILQLFLQHNFFTKKSIEEFTGQLTQLPYSFTIHLSLQWKDYVEVEKLLVIDVQNDNLVLKSEQQQHSTQPSIASLTCNDIPAQHDKRPDIVSSATDDTDEDDTESGWNKVKNPRRGRRHK